MSEADPREVMLGSVGLDAGSVEAIAAMQLTGSSNLDDAPAAVVVVALKAPADAEQWSKWADRSTRHAVLLGSADAGDQPNVTVLDAGVAPSTLRAVCRLAVTRVREAMEAEDARHQAWVFDCFLHSVPDMLFIKDRKSRFLGCSDVWRETCFPGQPYLGLTDFDIFRHAQVSYDLEQEIIRTGRPEWELRDGNKSKKTRLCTRVPLRDRQDRIVGTMGLHTDLNRIKKIEFELEHSSALLEMLLKKLPDRIYFKDRNGRYIRCSQSVADQYGVRKRKDVMGRTDQDFFTDEHAAAIREEEMRIMRRGEVVRDKLEQEKMRDGRICWSLTSKMPLVNREDVVIGIMGISKDVTQLKLAEQELEKLNEQLMKTSRQAGMAEVATGVLHNVGNVLNSVNVAASMATRRVRDYQVHNLRRLADLMAMHKDDLPQFISEDERGRNLPAFISHLAEHMSRSEEQLLSEMQLLSRNIDHIKEIVATQQTYAKTAGAIEVALMSDVIEDAIRINIAAMEREGITLIRDMESLPPIEMDRPKVLQILVNLLSNARHAVRENDDGHREIRLRLREVGDAEGRFMEIQVADNGVGIAPDHLPRVFAHGFTTRQDGHGFGLHSGAIAARSMGGRLIAESDGVSRGAAFTLIVPMELAGAYTS